MKDEWVIIVRRFNMVTGTELEKCTMQPSEAVQFPSPEIVRMATTLIDQGFTVTYNPSEFFAFSQNKNQLLHGVAIWSEDDDE